MTGKVAIGYCVSGMPLVHLDWHLSVTRLRGVDETLCVRGGTVASNRNDLVRLFLESLPDSYEWLAMTDVDGTFEPDIIERLLACDKPFVGALAFAGKPYGPVSPTIYVITGEGDERRLQLAPSYPKDELIPVHATGAHFLLVHRSVLVKIEQMMAGSSHFPWFEEIGMLNGPSLRHVSEDVAFCMRAGKVGVQPFVHTGVRTGHLKMANVEEWVFDALGAGVAFSESEQKIEVASTDEVIQLNRERRRELIRNGKVPR